MKNIEHSFNSFKRVQGRKASLALYHENVMTEHIPTMYYQIISKGALITPILICH